jgi:hypothetical protein
MAPLWWAIGAVKAVKPEAHSNAVSSVLVLVSVWVSSIAYICTRLSAAILTGESTAQSLAIEQYMIYTSNYNRSATGWTRAYCRILKDHGTTSTKQVLTQL